MTAIKVAESGSHWNVTFIIPKQKEIELNKRLHDIKGAIRTLELCMESLQSGYKFDDSLADAKINALSKATQTAAKELALVIEAIEACRDM